MPQVTFNRINAVAPSHTLQDDELQTATNLDLSLGQGALLPRRGCNVFGTVTAGQSLGQIFRNYNLPDNIGGNQFYVTDGVGSVYRGSAGSWTSIITGGHADLSGINSFGTYAVIASGTKYIKDDGTNATEWIKQRPGTPTITVNTLAPMALSDGTNTFVPFFYGTLSSAGSTATADSDSAGMTFNLPFASPKNLTLNGTNTIGDFGVHFVDLAFSDPTVVTKITQKWSVGDATYANYFTAELNPGQIVADSAQPDPNTLIDSQLAVGTSSVPLAQADRERMIAAIRDNNRSAASLITRVSSVFSPLAVARPDFRFVGRTSDSSGADLWASVYAGIFIIEVSGTCTATIRSATVNGAQNYPLTDIDVGYTWWQTYATLDTSSNKIGESAPSPPSARAKMQSANATVVQTGTATGTIHGITHMITYRQGGYTRDAYAVSTVSLGTYTITDTTNDIQALSIDDVMLREIYNPVDFPGNVVTIAEPWASRVFFGETNKLHWSLPGQIDAFPKTSVAAISNIGDNLKAIIPWPPGLVLVNQYSVFEFTGSDLESGDYLVQRSGSKRGSIAPRVAIKTPHGIPLLNYDGLTMYTPGQGIDSEIPWLINDYGDMFKGAAAGDPAALKGSRIPAINRAFILDSSAAYAEGKLYLACATGSATTPNTVYVIDFNTKRAWWYNYQFNIRSLFWDTENSRLFAGTTDGRMMQIETGVNEVTTANVQSSILWKARSKAWSVATENILENVFIEAQGTGPTTMTAGLDGTNTVFTTWTDTARQWRSYPLNGTFNNLMQFEFDGLTTNGASAAVYQLQFDLIPTPPRVTYYRTPFETKDYEGDKLWDVGYYDVAIRASGTNTMSAVTFVDGTAVHTATLTASDTHRHVYEKSFPNETYGRVAFTTFTGTASFQPYASQYDSRAEPAKINNYRTDIQSLEENICDAYDTDINPNGTVLATCYVDNTAVATDTITGTNRQSYTNSLARELYGRTIYVLYNGTAFKHYKTWFHLRLEPDRGDSTVSDKKTFNQELEVKVFKPELNCLGNTVLCTTTVEVDGAQTLTVHTATGSERMQYTFSMPLRAFGRNAWAGYQAVSGVFKHYSTDFDGDPEPPRVTLYRTGPNPFISSNYLKTWLARLDPISGPVTGVLFVDDVALKTATFTGTAQQWFTTGLDLSTLSVLQTGSRWEAVYSGTAKFKHYETKMESEAKPFGKPVWAFTYRKLGGASQIDLARFLSMELEGTPGATVTWYLDINGTNFATNTTTLGTGPLWYDRIPLPPGGRGYLFEVRLQGGSTNFKTYKVNLDLAQEGIKHLVRRESEGTPKSNG